MAPIAPPADPPPATFALHGPCPAGGMHRIVPEGGATPYRGTTWRLCWRCKSLFLWAVGPPELTAPDAPRVNRE